MSNTTSTQQDNTTSITTSITSSKKIVDLFAGTGAFSLAFSKNSELFKTVFSNDFEKSSETIYKDNFPDSNFILKDIHNIDVAQIPSHDILCGGFPCFIIGTKIITNTGYKNIENVTLDDKLLSHTGEFKSIINIQQKIYTGKLYNIKTMYRGEIITCTEEHPFYIREKVSTWNNNLRKLEHHYKEPIWKKANEIKKHDYFGMIINNKNIIPNFTFNKYMNKYTISTEKIELDKLEMWFMMGYFVGDGWTQDCKKKDGRLCYEIRFSINNKDYDEVYRKISTILPITDKKCDSGNYCKKYGCSNFLWYNIFKQFGKYAHNKFIPEWIQDAPTTYIQEFINGYMKADGCILKNNIHQITTVSHDLAYGIQRLYLKLGHIFSVNKCFCCKTTTIEGRIVNQRDTYTIRGNINKKTCYSFIEGNYHWFPLKDISITDNTNNTNIPVYNFEVEKDNSYIVNNTIVHNCQPFSIAGEQKGFDDKRANVFWKILEILLYHKPEIFILENVKNLKGHDNGNTYKTIISKLTELNYHIKTEILDTAKITNIPQHRERIYLVGFLDKTKYDKFTFDFPKIQNRPIKDFLESNNSIQEKYYYTDRLKVFEIVRDGITKSIDDNVLYQLRRGYIRENMSHCCPTMTANMGGGGHNVPLLKDTRGIRKLTPRECFNLQGFPTDYKLPEKLSDSALYKLAGNAVSVPVVELIVKKIYKLIA